MVTGHHPPAPRPGWSGRSLDLAELVRRGRLLILSQRALADRLARALGFRIEPAAPR
jgi:hypothetical protein